MKGSDAIFWFRRDLRLHDNCGLYHALANNRAVQPIFIFDSNILDELENRSDKRVSVIYDYINDLHRQLRTQGCSLKIYHGDPAVIFEEEVLKDFPQVRTVYANKDYEPYAKERDGAVADYLSSQEIAFSTFKDHVIFEKDEVVKSDGKPYTVFTLYYKVWKEKLEKEGILFWNTQDHFANFCVSNHTFVRLEELDFEYVRVVLPKKGFATEDISEYGEKRDFPSRNGTSKLSVHLRFGSISTRALVDKAREGNAEVFISELAWRDFYQQILFHFPRVKNRCFKEKYERIPWRNNEEEFAAWCEGRTGIPIVDAGMRELNETGYIHNRVRMIVASFLTKNLLIDWRWGERYFAEKLLDYDMAANTGGWQWAAGCGTDAAPYFRVFNPITQAEKFDPKADYIKKWVPEVNESSYPKALVDIKESRQRAIETYKAALN